jgi:hypothetical protein
MLAPTYAYSVCGSLARALIVASTATPKPIAKTVMPDDLSRSAVAIACVSPPNRSLCLPSVSTITTRGTPARTPGPSSRLCAATSPPEMLVLPKSSCRAFTASVALSARPVRSLRMVAESAKRTTPTWVPLVPPPNWKESAISRANCFTWSIQAFIEPEQSMTSTSSSVASHAGASGGAGGAGAGQWPQLHASGQRYRMILPYVAS